MKIRLKFTYYLFTKRDKPRCKLLDLDFFILGKSRTRLVAKEFLLSIAQLKQGPEVKTFFLLATLGMMPVTVAMANRVSLTTDWAHDT